MAQLFSPAADTTLRVAFSVVAGSALAFFPIRSLVENSSYATHVGEFVEQPVPFSHKHHVGDVGLDCRYCHTSVEQSSAAGMPSTETCMGCHSHLWPTAGVLAPVRSSYESGIPLRWNRVTQLPDYVYFNHSIHVTKGIGCETCHGRIDRMPLTTKVLPFHMENCLTCHRNPEKFIRPREEVFKFGWKPDKSNSSEGTALLARYGIRKEGLTDCVTCHR